MVSKRSYFFIQCPKHCITF